MEINVATSFCGAFYKNQGKSFFSFCRKTESKQQPPAGQGRGGCLRQAEHGSATGSAAWQKLPQASLEALGFTEDSLHPGLNIFL